MKNAIEIVGNTVWIFVRGGPERLALKTSIDIDDLSKVQMIDAAWHVNYQGYVWAWWPKTNPQKHHLRLHRLIMDAPRHLVVDHINHDTLDNRRCNLRVVDQATNVLNRRIYTHPYRSNHSCGLRGVTWANGKWQSQVQYRHKTYYLGRFDDANEAASAARKKLVEFDRLCVH